MTQDELNAALAASPSPDRVTPEYLKSRVAKVEFHRLAGGTMTLCILTVDNGFQLTGTSACADPANYKKDVGEKISYDNAERGLWPLLGFALKEAMKARDVAKSGDWRDRVRAERAELADRLGKLRAFLGTGKKPDGLGEEEFRRMQQQRACMAAYLDVLDERIEAFPA